MYSFILDMTAIKTEPKVIWTCYGYLASENDGVADGNVYDVVWLLQEVRLGVHVEVVPSSILKFKIFPRLRV